MKNDFPPFIIALFRELSIFLLTVNRKIMNLCVVDKIPFKERMATPEKKV
jgi:hypothetical protein